MPHIKFYKDETDFKAFIKDYSIRLKNSFNKIVKVRCYGKPFEECLTIRNPELDFKDDFELVPLLKIPCTKIRHFYVIRIDWDGLLTTSYFKVSTYETSNFERSGLPLSFNVVNKISAIAESLEKKDKRHKKLNIDLNNNTIIRDKNYLLCNRVYDRILIKGDLGANRPEEVYYSDIEWEKRLKYYIGHDYPYTLHPKVCSGDTFTKCHYNPNKKVDPEKSPLIVEPDDIYYNAYEVNYYTGGLFQQFTWLPREENIVERYMDVSLMRFLAHKEIPIWASITANSLQRPIKDHELAFINESYIALIELFDKYLNAMTLLSTTILHDFITDLIHHKIIAQCRLCDRLMRFRKGKKYCSKSSEGRDCGRKKRNKTHYGRHRDKITQYYRKEMKMTRQFEKELSNKRNKRVGS